MATNNYLYKDAKDLQEMVDLNDALKQLYSDDTSMRFPSIVIAGEQSHGKTSLIENITNLNLPRGTGVQTRVPTEIQLRPSPVNNYTIRYTPLGSHESKQINFTEENLEEKMRRVQVEVTGNETDISDESVTLTIERPDLLPLTIIDLPGYVVNRIENSGGDIELIMKALYTRYIADENNTILCVLNAANDIENSQVLKLCREVDRKGVRTMICVTKIDLRASGGYEAYRRAAAGWNIRRLFFVRNKNEKERAEKVSSEQVRKLEKAFIDGHKELRHFPEEQKGILALRDYLVKLQRTNIIPCLEHNYQRILEILAQKEREQLEIGKAMEKPEHIRRYIQERLRLIFAEVKELYTNVYFDIISMNYYLKEHTLSDEGVFQISIKSKRMLIHYKVESDGEETAVTFNHPPNEEMYFEIVTADAERINGNISAQAGPHVARFKRSPFTISARVLSAKDFFYYRGEVSNLFQEFLNNHQLSYFISPTFEKSYNDEKSGIFAANNLPDYDNIFIAEKILFKQIVPKMKDYSMRFKEWSKRFVTNLYESRIKSHFDSYKNLQGFLIERVKSHYAQPFVKVDKVLTVICENASKITLTDPMYLFKVENLKSVFTDGNANTPSEFLKAVCGENFDFAALKEVYRTNPGVYFNGVRAWAYMSTIFPNFKDNVTKTVQNHLIQKPLDELEFELYSIFDNEFFANKEKVDRYMAANDELQQKQIGIARDIEQAHKSIEMIKRIPRKFPHLVNEFAFIDDDDDFEEEGEEFHEEEEQKKDKPVTPQPNKKNDKSVKTLDESD